MTRQHPSSHSLLLLSCFLFLLVWAAPLSAEWKEKVLYSFQGGADGAAPVGGVVVGPDGTLYGATQFGGADNCSPMAACGTVYQLTPQKDGLWAETVLYVFKGKAFNDGEYPEGGLIADPAGNLYGTTAYGGSGNCVLAGSAAGCGTVFELSPPQQKGQAWTETILYSFPTAKQGYVPAGDLVFDASGNLYGSTIFGGGKGTTCDPFYRYCGAVFELSPPKNKHSEWMEKILHSFAGGSDGANPNGGLVFDSEGNVYGTTYSGGNQYCVYEGESGCGTAFELQPPIQKGGTWREKVLHHFDRNNTDGGNPMAGLVIGNDQKLFGTTLNGGPDGGGIAFCLSPSSEKSGAWAETILNAFGNNVFGYDLESPLVFDRSGNLYGTANTGEGGAAYGNVFQLKSHSLKGPSWSLSILYDFLGVPDGGNPVGNLTFGRADDLYGITQYGGTGTSCDDRGCGTVFELSP